LLKSKPLACCGWLFNC